MLLYVVRRLLQTVPLLLFISALIFLLLYLMPGDPIYRMLEGIPNLRPADYDRLRRLYGLDDPVYAQPGNGSGSSSSSIPVIPGNTTSRSSLSFCRR